MHRLRKFLLLEESTMTRTDALSTTVQGQHRQTRIVETWGRRRWMEEESTRAVSGLWPGCPLGTDARMCRAGGML